MCVCVCVCVCVCHGKLLRFHYMSVNKAKREREGALNVALCSTTVKFWLLVSDLVGHTPVIHPITHAQTPLAQKTGAYGRRSDFGPFSCVQGQNVRGCREDRQRCCHILSAARHGGKSENTQKEIERERVDSLSSPPCGLFKVGREGQKCI